MNSLKKPTSGQQIALTCGVLTIVITFFLIIVGNNGISDLQLMKNERQALINDNNRLKRKNLDSYHEIERLKKDSTYIETIARQELGLVGKMKL